MTGTRRPLALAAVSLLTAPLALSQGDDCTTATPIAGLGVHAYSTAGISRSPFLGGNPCDDAVGHLNGDLFWQWTATAAGDYAFEVEGASITSVTLYEGLGCAATCRARSGGYRHAALVSDVAVGDMILVRLGAHPLSPVFTGTMTVRTLSDSCTALPDDALEDNDSCADAVLLAPGVYTGLFASGADPDNYEVVVPDGDTLMVEFGPASNDLFLRVLENCRVMTSTTNGTWSWTNDTGAAVTRVLEFGPREPSAPRCSNYDLSIESRVVTCTTAPIDRFEPNDSCDGAVWLPDGLHEDLWVDRHDRDHFRLCVPPGGTLRAVVHWPHMLTAIEPSLRSRCGGPVGTTQWGLNRRTFEYVNGGAVMEEVHLRVKTRSGVALPKCGAYDVEVSGSCAAVGTTFCDPAGTNASGESVHLTGTLMSGVGSGLHLEASGGPPGAFGYMLVSNGFIEPGGSIGQGRLCLVNAVGRYTRAGGPQMDSIGSFDASGRFLNLGGTSAIGTGFDVPSMVPLLGATIQPGDTWHFQLWYRDSLSGAATFNFSDGLSVGF